MTRIAEGVQRLGSPLVNFYAVEEGGRFTLVDTGLPGFYDQVAAAVGDLGSVEAVVLTHAHVDHVGNAERLRSEANIPVYVHVADEELARTAKQQPRDGSIARHLARPATYRLFAHMIRNGASRVPKIGAVTTFTDGEILDVPGRPRVIATPGHSAGHVALHFPSHGVLFSGDGLVTYHALTGRRGPQVAPAAFNLSSEEALSSLDHLEGIEADYVLAGHGEPWTEGPRRAVELARTAGVL